ncbi:MAG: DUF2065 domain-containing protein [Rhodospirillaceae bacterium]|jgi:uncharacterized protein YjeT (DUF2065 family)
MVVNIVTAVALVLVIEGLLYAIFPAGMKRMMEQALVMPEGSLRTAGLAAATLGVFVIWLLRG